MKTVTCLKLNFFSPFDLFFAGCPALKLGRYFKGFLREVGGGRNFLWWTGLEIVWGYVKIVYKIGKSCTIISPGRDFTPLSSFTSMWFYREYFFISVEVRYYLFIYLFILPNFTRSICQLVTEKNREICRLIKNS